jgi:hypothetical protein
VVDDLSFIPSSCSGSEWTSVAAQDGGRLRCSSAGVGSPLSTKFWRFIPGYRRCFTRSMARAGLIAMVLFCRSSTSNQTPP